MPASSRRAESGAGIRARAARDVADVVAGRKSLTDCYRRWARADESTGLLRALVTGTLRWHFRLQWQVEQLLDRPLAKKEIELAALLRLGLFQLQFMRIPAHAAVDETVAATAILRRRHSRGLVNAVLRAFQRRQSELDQLLEQDPVARFSHPAWLIDALHEDWPEAAEQILLASNEAPPLWLRVNQKRSSPRQYAQRLTDAGIAFTQDQHLAHAIRLETAMSVARLPGFAAGEVSVQDRNAQVAVELLHLEPACRVLDACAAPGGKTAAMLERMTDRDSVVAIDQSEERLATVRENLERLGLTATVVCADATQTGQWWDEVPFDRVLLDAPCSATGVIRRHPDIKLRRTPAQVESAAATQRALLVALWPLLATGGQLLYVTCSVLRRENHAQIEWFLAEHEGAELLSERQCLPGEADGDGFYYACVKKRER
jgi:16S rRNA (cytosine967-C5)-methyltransferase